MSAWRSAWPSRLLAAGKGGRAPTLLPWSPDSHTSYLGLSRAGLAGALVTAIGLPMARGRSYEPPPPAAAPFEECSHETTHPGRRGRIDLAGLLIPLLASSAQRA